MITHERTWKRTIILIRIKLRNIYRNTKELQAYTGLLLRPTLVGIIGSTFWYFFHHLTNIDVKDQGVFESLLVAVSIAHGSFASMQIQKVSDQNQKIQQAFDFHNKEQFEAYQGLRINPVIKFLFAIFSLVFFIIFLLYPFANNHTGVIVVWFIMFILYLLWEVAAELDDPYHGVWKITPEQARKVFGKDVKIGKIT